MTTSDDNILTVATEENATTTSLGSHQPPFLSQAFT